MVSNHHSSDHESDDFPVNLPPPTKYLCLIILRINKFKIKAEMGLEPIFSELQSDALPFMLFGPNKFIYNLIDSLVYSTHTKVGEYNQKLKKKKIQQQVPLPLPCYDFTRVSQ